MMKCGGRGLTQKVGGPSTNLSFATYGYLWLTQPTVISLLCASVSLAVKERGWTRSRSFQLGVLGKGVELRNLLLPEKPPPFKKSSLSIVVLHDSSLEERVLPLRGGI